MQHQFTVASFNLENLNSIGTFYEGRDQTPYDAASFDKKAAFVADMLNNITAPCIIGVQEVFDPQALKDCVARSSMSTAQTKLMTPLYTTAALAEPTTTAAAAAAPKCFARRFESISLCLSKISDLSVQRRNNLYRISTLGLTETELRTQIFTTRQWHGSASGQASRGQD